jgi:hypothetical protein
MSGIFPRAPRFSSAETDATPACEWVMPAFIPRRNHARTCTPLPPGMPDCLEVSVMRSEEGVERTTAIMYGARAYLIHYEFKPHRKA